VLLRDVTRDGDVEQVHREDRDAGVAQRRDQGQQVQLQRAGIEAAAQQVVAAGDDQGQVRPEVERGLQLCLADLCRGEVGPAQVVQARAGDGHGPRGRQAVEPRQVAVAGNGLADARDDAVAEPDHAAPRRPAQ
jgi:hypothetical protein